MTIQTMQTMRLRLAVLQPGHAEVLFDDLSDPRIYAHIPQRPPESVGALRRQYTQLAAGPGAPHDQTERWMNWVLFRASDDKPIGWLQATYYPHDHAADVAWVLFPHAWRQGYATEAAQWLLDHLRDDWGVTVAKAEIDTGNVASIALAARLAFTWHETVPTDEGEDHVYVKSLVP